MLTPTPITNEPAPVAEPEITQVAPDLDQADLPPAELDAPLDTPENDAVSSIFRSARQGMPVPDLAPAPDDSPDHPEINRIYQRPAHDPDPIAKPDAPQGTPDPVQDARPASIDSASKSSVLDVLRQEAAYSSDLPLTAPQDAPADEDGSSEADFSLEIPELASDDDPAPKTAETPTEDLSDDLMLPEAEPETPQEDWAAKFDLPKDQPDTQAPSIAADPTDVDVDVAPEAAPADAEPASDTLESLMAATAPEPDQPDAAITPTLADPVKDAPSEPDVPAAPAREPLYDTRSVTSVKDEISEMFDKIQSAKTPQEPTIATPAREDTFNLRKDPVIEPTPEITTETVEQPTIPSLAQSAALTIDTLPEPAPEIADPAPVIPEPAAVIPEPTPVESQPEIPQSEIPRPETAAPEMVAAPSAGQTEDVASFIERLKRAEHGQNPDAVTSSGNLVSAVIPPEPVEPELPAAATPFKTFTNTSDPKPEAQISQVEEPAAVTPRNLAAELTDSVPKDIPDPDIESPIVPAATVALRKGKEVFADVADLESALEIEADKAEADKSDVAEKAKKAKDRKSKTRSGGSFMSGFYLACALVALGTVVYKYSPGIKDLLPASAASVDGFTSAIDTQRLALQTLYTDGGEPGLANFGSNAMDAIINR